MKNLDDFLSGDDTGQAEAEQPSAAEKAPQAPVGEPPAAAEAGPATPVPAKPAEEADDAQPPPEDVVGLKSALQAERARRRDYKGERDRLAGQVTALQAQIEAATKAPPPPAPAAAATPVAQPLEVVPNLIEDPDGYHRWNEARQERQRFSDKLDISEDRLREQIGDDADVDARIAKFKELAAANPALGAELRKHRHPYKFAYDYVKKAQAMEEIGDPVSYREKLAAEIRAEERAKLEAEYGEAPQAGARRVVLPQSLGTARSAGPRTPAVFNVPEDFNDILRPAARK